MTVLTTVRPTGRPGHETIGELVHLARMRVQAEVSFEVVPEELADLSPRGAARQPRPERRSETDGQL